MHKSHQDQRGSAFLMIMLMAVPMFGALGLVVDVGWAYFTRQAAHMAAESAALAAAQAAVDGIKSGGTYTCGSSKGLTCQVATVCPTSIPSPTTSNLQNGCAYAIANGFTNGGLGGKQTVSMEANVTSGSVPNVPGIARAKYWVSTRITQQNPLTFGGVLGGQNLNVGVRATAAVIATAPQNCITALNPTAASALTISGGSVVNAACGVAVDSNASNALNLNGGSILNADAIQVVGGYSGSGMTPTPITNAAPVADPYVNLPAPPASSSDCTAATTNVHYSGGTVTLDPGTYCGGIQISGATTVTFNPGTYVLLGGGLAVTGNGSSLTGSGVMFYNTCNPSPCNGGNSGYASVSTSGGTTVNLSGETSGLYAGILFYQDRTVSGSNLNDTISGNSAVTLTGVLYFPNSQLTYSGGSGSVTNYMVIVANTVKVTGNSTVGSPFSSSSILSVTYAALIE